MAQIVQQTIQITISRLVKDSEEQPMVCTPEQLINMMETLPGVVEQLMDDSGAVVEVNLES